MKLIKMKKQFSLFLLLSIFISCTDQNDKKELEPLRSSITELAYPIGSGYSGDTINGLIGYGYDATGFCDTISVKAKIFDSIPSNNLFYGNPNTAFPTLESGVSFEDLLSKIKNMGSESGTALSHHLKSLMKLAFKTDSIDPNYSYTYYAANYIYSHRKFFYRSESLNNLNADFKKNVIALSPEEIVSIYGTHVLTDVFTGSKFEILYRCNLGNSRSENNCENLFYNRMKQYIGSSFGIYKEISADTKLSQIDEQMIYNSIGSRKKLCGVINTTDYNPDSIHIDNSQLFSDENIKTQFVSIYRDGILPIYELISNETKKQEVKAYIEKYISIKHVN